MARQLDTVTVEMECAAPAACSQLRKVDFAQILFTANYLANIEAYDERDWGGASHSIGLDHGSQLLARI